MTDEKIKLSKEELIEKLYTAIRLIDQEESNKIKSKLLRVKLIKNPGNKSILKIRINDDLIRSCLSTFELNIISDILEENKIGIDEIIELTRDYKRFWGEIPESKGSISIEKFKTVILCYHIDFIINKYSKTKIVKLEGIESIRTINELSANNIALNLIKMSNNLFTEDIKIPEKIQVMQFMFNIAKWKDDKEFRDKQYNIENNAELIPNNNVLDLNQLKDRILNSKKNLKDTI